MLKVGPSKAVLVHRQESERAHFDALICNASQRRGAALATVSGPVFPLALP
eukprot:m.13167 g.13167  ORF g.13167 m.13167 type:complete len:51 (+) comp4622_c0_seq2:30-182(+)